MADNAILVLAAEAVAHALASAPLLESVEEPRRSYADWALPLEDAAPSGRILLDVVPVAGPEIETATRASLWMFPEVDVVVRYRFGPQERDTSGRLTLERVDALVEFVEDLAAFFAIDRFEGGGQSFTWESTTLRAAYIPALLREHSQFTGVIRLRFRTEVALDRPSPE
jgi:hypothetical protein